MVLDVGVAPDAAAVGLPRGTMMLAATCEEKELS
jgi:hypothetical protein